MRLTGFHNKIAFVTGAAGGIGSVLVKQLHDAGARVIAADIDGAVSADLEGFPDIHFAALDVRDGKAVTACIDRFEDQLGPIDIGINVAGICRTGPACECAEDDWLALMDINAGGVFHVCTALARHMKTRRRGNIVTVSSNAAGIPRHGMAAYAASKAAATLFTRSLGLELAAWGIRCNVVAPGSTLTPMQTALWQDPDAEAAVIAGSLEHYKTGIPLGRLASPDSIAQSVMFLLSDQASHITMSNLYVDGGATLVG